MREIVLDWALIVRVFVLLVNVIEGKVKLVKDCFFEGFGDEGVWLGKKILSQFRVADLPILQVQVSHQLYNF